MLVIGGTGYLYGGLFGAIAFKLLHDLLSAWTPQYWNFWIGLFLVVLVLVGRDRLLRPWTRAAAMSGAQPVLETRGLVKRFGGIVPTNDVSLQIALGARHALIGPNGAGKTTLINLLSGTLAPSAGSIWLDGADITRLAPHLRVRRGVVRTFQINQLFGGLTPLQSLALAVSTQLGIGAGGWQRLGADPRIGPACDALLRRFRLEDVQGRRIAELAYGKRRLLEIALALACGPRVLLLDEPVAGVPAGEREEIFDIVNALAGERVGAPDRARHGPGLQLRRRAITVLVDGAVFAEGDAATVAADPRVKAVYLGEGRPWLSCSGSRSCAPATARRSCCKGSSFVLHEGQSLALLGRNGTGKTTLLNTLVGVTRRFAGRIVLDGRAISRRCRRIAGSPPASAGCRRSATSSARSPRTRTSPPSPGRGRGPWNASTACSRGLPSARANLRPPAFGRRAADARDGAGAGAEPEAAAARRAARRPGADHRRGAAGSIARVVREEGMSAIIVEQNPRLILPITQSAIVLDRGRIVHEGGSAELLQDRAALDRWLAVARE